jgi:shikimate kinase
MVRIFSAVLFPKLSYCQ